MKSSRGKRLIDAIINMSDEELFQKFRKPNRLELGEYSMVNDYIWGAIQDRNLVEVYFDRYHSNFQEGK